MPNPTGRGYATELLPPGVATYVVVTGDGALGVAVLAVLAPVDLHVRKHTLPQGSYTCDVHGRTHACVASASARLFCCCLLLLYYAIYKYFVVTSL